MQRNERKMIVLKCKYRVISVSLRLIYVNMLFSERQELVLLKMPKQTGISLKFRGRIQLPYIC